MHILLKENDVLVLENLRNRTHNDMAHQYYECAEFVSFFLLNGLLNTERRNNAPAFTAGQDMICFFYFFVKLTF